MASPKITKKKTSQQINLKDEFGVDFSGRDALKQAIGQAIIDKMLRRVTEDNKGAQFSDESGTGRRVNLRSPYSDAYQESDEFKAAGKSATDINMTLKGDMLNSIDLLKIRGNTIEVGIDDDDEAGKAHGHMTGKNGKVPKMRRPFFGVTKAELKEIRREFAGEIKDAIKASKKGDDFDQAVTKILERVRGGES